ncbi:MAG: glutamate synthase-related protein [Firmicutes bacterium]|jgi:hypothetical protein|nr:glutamate synthase-related protein [Bacillota bacterium]MCL5065878.1 glutamate synthase-related protein [Bacillota bacterium]
MKAVLLAILTTLTTLALILGVGVFFARWVARKLEASAGHSPQYTLWEILFTLRARHLASILLTVQRAERSKLAEHPMGSAPSVDWFQVIGIDPATFKPPPRPEHSPVDLTTVLGAGHPRSISLSMPVIVAPMGYGVALNAETKVALAQASSLAGIAISTGEGLYLPEERSYAQRWILQQSRGFWAHDPRILALADVIEVQWGQGSEGATGLTKPKSELPRRFIDAVGGPAVIHAAPEGHLDAWIRELKIERADCPIAVKLPASQHLESDLAYLLTLPIEIITLDGSGAGSAGSAAVISDHFGITTALAIHRAHTWLVARGMRSQITLVASGGIRGAADIARLIGLGADAAAIGSSLLFAALHDQIGQHLPTPPTALAFAHSRANSGHTLDVSQAANHATNWLEATRAELAGILRVAGVRTLSEFRQQRPLIARTKEAARVFQLPFDGGHSKDTSLEHKLHALIASYSEMNDILADIEARLSIQSLRSSRGRSLRKSPRPG